MKPRKGTIETDGFLLNYLVEGKGIPTLIIGSSIFYPRVFSKKIKTKLQLIFTDHRGFVPPPNRIITNDDFSLEKLINDVEILRQSLGLTKFLIAGHSGHAFLALEYAKKYPENILGVLFIGASPDYSEKSHRLTDAYFFSTALESRKTMYENAMQLLPALIQENPEKRFVHFCLCSGARNWYQPDFDASPLWEGVYTNMQMIDYVWGTVFRDIEIEQGLERFRLPVLLLLGKYDYVTGPPELWNNVKTKFFNIKRIVFEQSGHYPMLEEPEIFDNKVLDWLKENGITIP